MKAEPAPPGLSRATVSQQYQSSANLDARITLHERFSLNPQGFHAWRFDQFDLPPEARILEVGCGTGLLWAEAAERTPTGWRLTLTDFSAGMLAQTRRNLAALLPAIHYAQQDAARLAFAPGSFDAVFAHHMLYYVGGRAERAETLAGLARALKPGGRFYAATNGLNHMVEMEEMIREFDPAISVTRDFVSRFSLESGPAEVAEWFEEVEVRRYPDALVVTELQPLIDYGLSTSHTFTLPPETKAALADFIRQRFEAAGGVMRIQKDAGMICATATPTTTPTAAPATTSDR